MDDRSIHDSMGQNDILDGLDHIMHTKNQGEVIFGAKNESLWKSQAEILSAIGKNIAEGKTDGTVVAAGGAGKTRVGIALGAAVAHHGRKTLFVVDRQESLQKFAEDARKLMPGTPIGQVYQEEKTLGDLTFITIDSLRARVKAFRDGKQVKDGAPINPETYDMVVWDEAHMYLTPKAQALKNEFSHCVNIALTATPRYYEGKEVQDFFGPTIKEISYATALERKEVNPYSNHLINTGIKTGLTKLKPEEEESGAVGKANNRRDRNLIAADIYKNGSIVKDGEKTALAGMRAVVLVTSINHANDQAAALNEALMPLLKNDSVFRANLRGHGIDPDKVERIAAPMHSGASDQHGGLSLAERNKVTKDYKDGKTLMLVSTRLLQQSWDSPETQMVIDTVPRMTYVGVGQGGYRATRIKAGKGDSVNINYEDADRPTLTFDDFTKMRALGAEEGTKMPMMEVSDPLGPKPSDAPEQAKQNPVAPYSIVSGQALTRLLVEREQKKTEAASYPAERATAKIAETVPATGGGEEAGSFRYCTVAENRAINAALQKLGGGDSSAMGPFLTAMTPYITRSAERMGARTLGVQPEKENVQDAVGAILVDLLENPELKDGSIRVLSDIGGEIQGKLKQIYVIQKRDDAERADGALKLAASVADDNANDPHALYVKKSMREQVDKTLRALPPRQRQIVWARSRDETLEEIALPYFKSSERISRIEAKGIRILKHPSRSDALLQFYNETNDQVHKAPPPAGSFEVENPLPVAREEAIRSGIAKIFSTPYGILVEKSLSPQCYKALMQADLVRDRDACELLQREILPTGLEILRMIKCQNDPEKTGYVSDAYKLADDMRKVKHIAAAHYPCDRGHSR